MAKEIFSGWFDYALRSVRGMGVDVGLRSP
jgi:hypothetical protein